MDKSVTVAEYFTDVRPNRRIHNALVLGGIHTMAEVSAMSEGELTRVRHFGVFLETEDVERIAEHLGLPEEDFIGEYLAEADADYRIKTQPCGFLEKDGSVSITFRNLRPAEV